MIVLDAIRGKDHDDLSSRDIPFSDPFSVDITKLTVGYLEDAEMEVRQVNCLLYNACNITKLEVAVSPNYILGMQC